MTDPITSAWEAWLDSSGDDDTNNALAEALAGEPNAPLTMLALIKKELDEGGEAHD